MGKYLSKIVLSCLLGIGISSFAMGASLPDGAVVKVQTFTFPKAAYTGSDEEAARLSSEFYSHLVTALEQTGLQVNVSSHQEVEENALPVQNHDVDMETSVSEKETISDKQNDIQEQTNEGETVENDQLMQLVKTVEKEKLTDKKDKKQVVHQGPYTISGTITQYEEQVGASVSTGNTKRSRATVSLLGSYKVVDSLGKTIILEKVSASASKIVSETMDIYTVLQSLGKKTFIDASANIAERISGKKQVEVTDEANPGTEEDEYADSPGKRLKSKSGRMKWIVN